MHTRLQREGVGILLEGRRVLVRDADVFVEVEAGHLGPINSLNMDEVFNHLELRCTRGKDDVGLQIQARHRFIINLKWQR